MKFTIVIDVKSGSCHMMVRKFLKMLKKAGHNFTLFNDSDENTTFEDIICDEVTNLMGKKADVEALRTNTRKEEVVCARQICMMFRRKTKKLESSAAPYGKDHSTVCHSIKTIRNRYETDLNYREMIKRIEKRLEKKLVEIS